MKHFILYLLFTISIFANIDDINNTTTPNIDKMVLYVDGAIHDRIVIKLLKNTENSFTPSVSNITDGNITNSITLENIANTINSEVGILFPVNNLSPDINNPIQYYERELQKYRTIRLDENLSKDEVLQVINSIKKLENIDMVYAEPRAKVAYVDPSISPNSSNSPSVSQLGNFISYQGYLNPAPQGIDAKYAWNIVGGDGDGVKVIDVEWGWNYSHQDFPDFFAQLNASGSSSHGTAVAGVVSSLNNGVGTKGIAYNAEIGGSQVKWPQNGGWVQGVSDAIYAATSVLGKGDILIIEAHYPGPNTANCTCNQGDCNYIPMEYWIANFDAIQHATSKGITVVEAAGNGSVNLDHSAYNNKFNRLYRDSGAILVAASNSTGRTPACFTDYGSRIDVHGWGWDVTTTGYGNLYSAEGKNRYYTNTFSGTSSATPIVAGAAASLQGVAKARLGRFLTPEEVRSILSSTATPQTGGFSKRIGGLPDLRRAIAKVYQMQPLQIPQKPSNATLSSVTDDSAILHWTDNTSNEQGYRIYRGTTLIVTLPANVTSYELANLEANTSYTYTIRAFNSMGESAPLTVTFKTDINYAWMIPAIYYPILLTY